MLISGTNGRMGKLVFMIADVMGKGLPSSLLMSQIQAIMKIYSRAICFCREIVTAVNEFIYVTVRRKNSSAWS